MTRRQIFIYAFEIKAHLFSGSEQNKTQIQGFCLPLILPKISEKLHLGLGNMFLPSPKIHVIHKRYFGILLYSGYRGLEITEA